MLIWSWTTTPYSTNAFWSTIDLYIHHTVLAWATIDIYIRPEHKSCCKYWEVEFYCISFRWLLGNVLFTHWGLLLSHWTTNDVCIRHKNVLFYCLWWFSWPSFFIRKVLLIYREVPLHCIRPKKFEMKFDIQGMLSYSVLLKMARRNSPTTEEVI